MRDADARGRTVAEGPPASSGGGNVLVVGATRVLRPAVRALTGRGTRVSAVARDAAALAALAEESGPLVRPVAADAGQPGFAEALRRAAGATGFTGALIYTPVLPATACPTPTVLRGPCVLLLPSRWAAPAEDHGRGTTSAPWTPGRLPPLPGAGRGRSTRRLVLGWSREGGSTRWHTPEEISTAALALLDAPRQADAVLGEVRPWAARPA